jgi:hypothetical protein
MQLVLLAESNFNLSGPPERNDCSLNALRVSGHEVHLELTFAVQAHKRVEILKAPSPPPEL